VICLDVLSASSGSSESASAGSTSSTQTCELPNCTHRFHLDCIRAWSKMSTKNANRRRSRNSRRSNVNDSNEEVQCPCCRRGFSRIKVGDQFFNIRDRMYYLKFFDDVFDDEGQSGEWEEEEDDEEEEDEEEEGESVAYVAMSHGVHSRRSHSVRRGHISQGRNRGSREPQIIDHSGRERELLFDRIRKAIEATREKMQAVEDANPLFRSNGDVSDGRGSDQGNLSAARPMEDRHKANAHRNIDHYNTPGASQSSSSSSKERNSSSDLGEMSHAMAASIAATESIAQYSTAKRGSSTSHNGNSNAHRRNSNDHNASISPPIVNALPPGRRSTSLMLREGTFGGIYDTASLTRNSAGRPQARAEELSQRIHASMDSSGHTSSNNGDKKAKKRKLSSSLAQEVAMMMKKK
jgi:hypothetical protein